MNVVTIGKVCHCSGPVFMHTVYCCLPSTTDCRCFCLFLAAIRLLERRARYRSQWGIFAFRWFLSDISVTRGRIHTKFYLCRNNVCRRSHSRFEVHRPLGAGGGGVKNSKNLKKWWVVSFVHRTATISVFSQRFQMWFNM